jgi:hypothetical protein
VLNCFFTVLDGSNDIDHMEKSSEILFSDIGEILW